MRPHVLAPGLWAWSAPHPDWTPDRAGVGGWDRDVWSWLLEAEDRVVLIDPLLPADPDLTRWLDERVDGRRVDALVSVYWHLRSADAMHARYDATVWGNPKTREDVEQVVTGVIVDGSVLPAGVVPFTPIPSNGDEEETAFWLPRQRALAVGDILISTAAGVRLWWEQKTDESRDEYRRRVQPALRRLLELPIAMLLVPHGGPVADGHRALEEALEAPTWERPPEAG